MRFCMADDLMYAVVWLRKYPGIRSACEPGTLQYHPTKSALHASYAGNPEPQLQRIYLVFDFRVEVRVAFDVP